MRVSPTTKVTVGVPVHFINQDKAPGLKRGGIVNVVRHEIDLVCRADSIPSSDVRSRRHRYRDSGPYQPCKLPRDRLGITGRDFTIASIARCGGRGEQAGRSRQRRRAAACASGDRRRW